MARLKLDHAFIAHGRGLVMAGFGTPLNGLCDPIKIKKAPSGAFFRRLMRSLIALGS